MPTDESPAQRESGPSAGAGRRAFGGVPPRPHANRHAHGAHLPLFAVRPDLSPIIAGTIDASGTEEAAYSRVVSSEPSPEGEQQRTVRPPPPLLAELAVIDGWILSTYSGCDIACTYCITTAQGRSVPLYLAGEIAERLRSELDDFADPPKRASAPTPMPTPVSNPTTASPEPPLRCWSTASPRAGAEAVAQHRRARGVRLDLLRRHPISDLIQDRSAPSSDRHRVCVSRPVRSAGAQST